MSVITDMLIMTSAEPDHPALAALSMWCDENAGGQKFDRLPTNARHLEEMYKIPVPDLRTWTERFEDQWRIHQFTRKGRRRADLERLARACWGVAQRQYVPTLHFTGGRKVFTQDIYACSGNAFPWYDLALVFGSFGWGDVYDEKTVLVMDPEHSDGLYGVTGQGKALRQYTKGMAEMGL